MKLRQGFFHGGENVAVGAATAQVTAHQFLNLGASAGTSFIGKAYGRADLPRRAVAALESIVLDECLLHRMQRVAIRQAFDSGQFCAIAHDRQRQAGIDPLAVAQYGAGTALTVVAAFLGADQIESVAQQVKQGGPGLYIELTQLPIEGQRDRMTCDILGNRVRSIHGNLTVGTHSAHFYAS